MNKKELKKNLTLKRYEDIVKLLNQVDFSPEWRNVSDPMDHVYSGGSADDVDYVYTYYNEELDRAIRFIINYSSKTAMIQNFPVSELTLNNQGMGKAK